MAVENIVNLPVDVVAKLGDIALYLQALGIIIVLWILFQIVSLILNRKRIKEIYAIKEDMKRIERKLDKVIGTVRAR